MFPRTKEREPFRRLGISPDVGPSLSYPPCHSQCNSHQGGVSSLTKLDRVCRTTCKTSVLDCLLIVRLLTPAAASSLTWTIVP